MEVWQRADALALEVYRATQDFPREELYGITAQLRRAALSVPTNIVEGYARRGDKELARFIDIALGSLAELEAWAAELGGKLWRFYDKVRHGAKGSRRRE